MTAGCAAPDCSVAKLACKPTVLLTGHHRQPEMTCRCLQRDGWFHIKDPASVADGWVYVTGRQKDLIGRGGKAHSPEDLEEIAGRVPGCILPVVAFGLRCTTWLGTVPGSHCGRNTPAASRQRNSSTSRRNPPPVA